jgi:CubicO group peptidase (beta-lactamase class C family)
MKAISIFLLLLIPVFVFPTLPLESNSLARNEAAETWIQASGEAGHENGRFAGVRDFIRKELVERQLPSLAVAVARDQQILWEEAFGWADRENRIPATPHTIYSLASISKPITATGLMILKERGKIDLDRPVNDYLGESKIRVRVGAASDATVRRILNHTSGLPLHYQFFYQDEPYRRPSMDETILRYGNAVTAPGERYQYSNLGYGVIDYVIARTSGESYSDFMKKEVFLPLGLTRMSVDIGPGLERYQAIRYGADGLPIPFYEFDHPGGSAIYASVYDLVRFGMFHLKARLPDQKRILSDQSLDEMKRPTAEVGAGAGYGIGWLTEDRGGHRLVQHSGGMGGVATILILLPDEKIVIAALGNSSSSLPRESADMILSVLVPDARRQTAPSPPQSPPFKPTSRLLGIWTGTIHTYKSEIPLTLDFKQSGDVHARLGSQLKTLINNVSFRDDYFTGSMMGDIGTEDANRLPYTLTLSLKLRSNLLNGAATAISLPGKRVGNALSHWVELKKD